MIDDHFTMVIHDIRAALKSALLSTQAKQPVNVIPIRDMIDALTQEMKIEAVAMDKEARDQLASDLLMIANDLEALEKLMEQHIAEDKN